MLKCLPLLSTILLLICIPSIAGHNITIYSIEGCHACVDTVKILNENNITYNLIKVNKSTMEKLLTYYQRANLTEKVGFPTTIIDEKYLIVGSFTPSLIRALQSNKLDIYSQAILLPNNNSNLKGNTTTTPSMSSNTSPTQQANEGNNIKNEINLPLYAIALANALNPCSLTLFIYYLSILIITTHTKEKIFKNTILFIIGVFITYMVLGITLLQIPLQLRMMILSLLAIILITMGIIRLIEGLKNIRIIMIPKKWIEKLKIVNNGFIGGIIYAIILTPCTLPPYVVGALLIGDEKWIWMIISYNVLLIMPLIIMACLINIGFKLEKISNISIKNKKWLKIVSGILLIILGTYFIFH